MNGVWVCMQREHVSEFPSANITNWLKHEQWQNWKSDSYNRITSNNANSLLQVRNAFWVFKGRAGGAAETRYKKYSGKSPCRGKSYETICESIVSWYQTLVSSLPRGTVFLHRRPKTEFISGQPWKGQPSNKWMFLSVVFFHFWSVSSL